MPSYYRKKGKKVSAAAMKAAAKKKGKKGKKGARGRLALMLRRFTKKKTKG